MDRVDIKFVSETYVKIICDPSIKMELADHFTFFVPGYKHMPKYKRGYWDGKIRLFQAMSGQIYAGLVPHIERYCEERGYQCHVDPLLLPEDVSEHDIRRRIEKVDATKQPRDYQIEAVIKALRMRRLLLLSPTASGKSLIMYLIARLIGEPTLIVVPTVNLVDQMRGDFADYGLDTDKFVHTIKAGADHNTNKPIVITTWQSIYKNDKKWFKRYKVILGDEAHHFSATSLKKIMENLDDCPYRIALTGSLDGTKTNQLVLEGLFGPVIETSTTRQLIDAGHIAEPEIKAIILQYPNDIAASARKFIVTPMTTGLAKTPYGREIQFLLTNKSRNKFIANLAASLDGNVLLLFRLTSHGNELYNILKEKQLQQNVYFVDGSVSGDKRNEIREAVNTSSGNIIVASVGTFSTGMNLPNLNHVIFSHPLKSRIKNLQSIGRALRLSPTKHRAEIYDISDDLSTAARNNTTYNHFLERIKLYAEQQLKVKKYKVALK